VRSRDINGPIGGQIATGSNSNKDARLRAYYAALYRACGPPHWWPAQSRLEVIVGAYLTQNTSWSNVERALASLRRAKLLSLDGIRRTPRSQLEKLIHSAGYFRQKARRLKTFLRFLDHRYGGSLTRMFAQSTAQLREELLALNGVGPETADSILLYAGNHPIFVVDAYTRRILERHQIIGPEASYEDIRELVERALASARVTHRKPAANGLNQGHTPSRISVAARPPLVQVFNEMHGLIVGVGKNYCKKSQKCCDHCPLREFLPGGTLPHP
jgi:endonuclease-3 related protein